MARKITKNERLLIDALKKCIDELKHSQPPEGGYTEELIKESEDVITQVEGLE